MRFLSAVVALSVTMTLVGAVAAQAQSPQAAPAATVGESFTLPSTVMGMERELNVLLPAGYADQPDRTWPVV